MKIKHELVLHGMTHASAEDIEYNTIGTFQTSDSNMPGYYIVKWKGNAYTLQEKYTCHVFDPPVIIPEGEIVFPSKFMTPTRKILLVSWSIWSNTFHGEVKTSCDAFHWIDSVQKYKNKLPSRFKGYAFMNPHLLFEHNHQIILDKIKARQNLNHDEYVEDENY